MLHGNLVVKLKYSTIHGIVKLAAICRTACSVSSFYINPLYIVNVTVITQYAS